MSHGKQDDPAPTDFGTDGQRVPTGSELLTVAEVSSILRVSKMTIYRMVHSGELAHVRVGRSFRIPTDAVRGILGARPSGDQSAV